MILRLIYILFYAVTILTLPALSQSQSLQELKAGDTEEIDKALKIIDSAFDNHEYTALEQILTDKVKESLWFTSFKRYISRFKINLNHATQKCKKEFLVNNNEKDKLVITFRRDKERNIWLVEDAYRNGRNDSLKIVEWGLPPLAFTRNFSDLISVLNSQDSKKSLGLAPHGKISQDFLSRNKLFLSRETELTLDNVIVHDGYDIRDFLFLTFKVFPLGFKEGGKNKSGWLLIDGGPMSARIMAQDDLYPKFLTGFLDVNQLNLNAPNEIMFVNIKEILKSKQSSDGHSYTSIQSIACFDHNQTRSPFLRIALRTEHPIDDFDEQAVQEIQNNIYIITLPEDAYLQEQVVNSANIPNSYSIQMALIAGSLEVTLPSYLIVQKVRAAVSENGFFVDFYYRKK